MHTVYISGFLLLLFSYTVYSMDDDECKLSSSAPAQYSKNQQPELYNDDDNDADNITEKQKTIKYNKHMSISLPALKNQISLLDNPFITSKRFLIVPSIIDDSVWAILEGNRKITKEVAKKHNLTHSAFYTIIKNMKKSVIQDNAFIITLANHFLFSLLKEKEFEYFLNTQSDYLRGSSDHHVQCIDIIRKHINAITVQAITWPKIARKENQELYYKQLLELNANADIAITQAPYIAGNVTIYFLSQLANRASNYKTLIKELMKSPKNIAKHTKLIQQSLAIQSSFIGKVVKHRTPKDNEKTESDE